MNCILYVDGFNFYYGVAVYWRGQPNLTGLGWCDFSALIRRHFADHGRLQIKYFTAPVTQNVERRNNPGEHKRYSEWMRALRTIDNLTVVEGFYKKGFKDNPDAPFKFREEKQTDVNLAIEMIMDAWGTPGSTPDHVYVLSDDCDLMPAIFALQERLPAPVEVSVLLPSQANLQMWRETYEKTSGVLRKCHNVGTSQRIPSRPIEVFLLDEHTLANSLLRYALHDSEGELSCPTYWKLPSEYLSQHCRKIDWRPDLPSRQR
jgi:hypothetical protein